MSSSEVPSPALSPKQSALAMMLSHYSDTTSADDHRPKGTAGLLELGKSIVQRRPVRLVHHIAKQRLELAKDVENDYVTGFNQHATFSLTPLQSMLLAMDESIIASLHRHWQDKIAERKRREARRVYFATCYSDAKARSTNTFIQMAHATANTAGGIGVSRAKRELAAQQQQQHLQRMLQDDTDEGDEKIDALKKIERLVRKDLLGDFSLHFSFESEKKRLAAAAHRAEQRVRLQLAGLPVPDEEDPNSGEWQGGTLSIRPFVVLLWDAVLQTNLFDFTGKSKRRISLAERRTSLRRVASLAIFNAAAAERRRKRLQYISDREMDRQDRRGRHHGNGVGSDDADNDDAAANAADTLDEADDADGDFFDRIAAAESDLFVHLADLFKTVDKLQAGAVSWDMFCSYMIETVYVPQVGGADSGSRFDPDQKGGSLLYKDSMKLTYPLYKPHWVGKLNFFAGWDTVAMHDGTRVVISRLETMGDPDFSEELGASKPFQEQEPLYDPSNLSGSGGNNKLVIPRGLRPQRPVAVGVKKKFITAEDSKTVEELGRVDHLKAAARASFIDHQATYLDHGGTVMASEYIGRDKIFITSASESKQLRFWSVQSNSALKFVNQIRLSYPHDCTVTAIRAEDRRLLRSDPVKLFYGTRDGHVIGDCITDECGEYFRRMQPGFAYTGCHMAKFHTDAVSDILVCPRTHNLVSGGLDGRLFMHLPFEGDPDRSKVEFVGHQRGILSLAYCHGYEIIVSAGFEYHAMCWAENVTRAPAFLLKDPLATSKAAICQVFTVQHTPHVYTVDLNAVVKLFDIRTLKTIGSWGAFDPGRVPTGIAEDVAASTGREHVGVIGAACFTGAEHRTILVAGKCVHRFMTESRNADVDRCLDNSDPIVQTTVGKLYIMTAGAKFLRLWSLVTGNVTATYQMTKFCPRPLTAAALCDVLNKVVSGHADGTVCVFSIDSGVLLRRYALHGTSIRSLLLDTFAGLLFTVAKTGEVSVWRDSDAKHKGTSLRAHLYHQDLDDCRPLPTGYNREMLPLARDEQHLLATLSSSAARVRRALLGHWVIHRWCALLVRNRLNRGIPEEETIRRQLSTFRTNTNIQTVHLHEATMNLVVVSCFSTVQLVNYAKLPPVATHRMFHGHGRQMTDAVYIDARSLCVTSDAHGLLFVWVVADERPAVLASCFPNKCLVSSFSKPTEEFAQDDDDDATPDDAVDHQHPHPHHPHPGRGGAGTGSHAASAAFTPPENPMPVVTTLLYDTQRNTLVTGDEVGYISLWELDDVLTGFCDPYDALQLSMPVGTQPFWVYAWRAGQSAITHLGTMPHSMAAIVSQVSDNTAAIWTVSGDWVASLRQGPVVDRSWHFPNELLERMSLIRIRYEKLYQAGQTGRLRQMLLDEEKVAAEEREEARKALEAGLDKPRRKKPKPTSRMHVHLFEKLSQRLQIVLDQDDKVHLGMKQKRVAQLHLLQRRFSTSFRGVPTMKREIAVPPPMLAAQRASSLRKTVKDATGGGPSGTGGELSFMSSVPFVQALDDDDSDANGSAGSTTDGSDEDEDDDDLLDATATVARRRGGGKRSRGIGDDVDPLEIALAKELAQRQAAHLRAIETQREAANLAAKHAEKIGTNSTLNHDPDAQRTLHVFAKHLKAKLQAQHEGETVTGLQAKRVGEQVCVHDHREYVAYLRHDETHLTVTHGVPFAGGDGGVHAAGDDGCTAKQQQQQQQQQQQRKPPTCRGDPMQRHIPLDAKEALARRALMQRVYSTAPGPPLDAAGAFAPVAKPVARGVLSLGGITAKVEGSLGASKHSRGTRSGSSDASVGGGGGGTPGGATSTAPAKQPGSGGGGVSAFAQEADVRRLLFAQPLATPPPRLPPVGLGGGGCGTPDLDPLQVSGNSPSHWTDYGDLPLEAFTTPYSSPIIRRAGGPSQRQPATPGEAPTSPVVIDPRTLFETAMASTAGLSRLAGAAGRLPTKHQTLPGGHPPTDKQASRLRVESLLRPLTDDRAVGRAFTPVVGATAGRPCGNLLAELEGAQRKAKKPGSTSSPYPVGK